MLPNVQKHFLLGVVHKALLLRADGEHDRSLFVPLLLKANPSFQKPPAFSTLTYDSNQEVFQPSTMQTDKEPLLRGTTECKTAC